MIYKEKLVKKAEEHVSAGEKFRYAYELGCDRYREAGIALFQTMSEMRHYVAQSRLRLTIDIIDAETNGYAWKFMEELINSKEGYSFSTFLYNSNSMFHNESDDKFWEVFSRLMIVDAITVDTKNFIGVTYDGKGAYKLHAAKQSSDRQDT